MEQPKVRFTKINSARADQPLSFSTSLLCPMHTENEKDNICKKNCLTNRDKVKIKSIDRVKFPIKVLKNGRHVLTEDALSFSARFQLDNQFSQNDPKSLSNSFDDNVQITCSAQTPRLSLNSCAEGFLSISSESDISTNGYFDTKQYVEDNKARYSQQLKSCTNDLQLLTINSSCTSDQQANSKILSVDIPKKADKSDYDYINIDDKDDNEDIKILKVINNSKKLPWDNIQNNDRKSYEISKSCDDHEVVYIKTSNDDNLDKVATAENKENHSGKIQSNKVSNTKSTVIPSILKDSSNAYSTNLKSLRNSKRPNNKITTQVMPCSKFRIPPLTKKSVVTQSTKAQINKKTMFNVTASKCNVSVQPGSSLKNVKHKSGNDFSQINSRKNIISKDILSQPEYNSTVNVIKKLKDIKNEKFNMDSEKLPPAYKNVINEKVSAALEFPPSESVYKNLISLADDNDDQFPTFPMRSKDPEPRDKDITPKLSDFYRPKFTGEYFMIANPIVREPEIVNTCYDFKISNKISMWKFCRDNDY